MDIVNPLNYFGIAPNTLTPLVLVWGVGFFIIAKYLKENIEPIKKSISRITNSIIEIQTLLKVNNIPLNHLLIEAPGSPLQPTEYGAKIIKGRILFKWSAIRFVFIVKSFEEVYLWVKNRLKNT